MHHRDSRGKFLELVFIGFHWYVINNNMMMIIINIIDNIFWVPNMVLSLINYIGPHRSLGWSQMIYGTLYIVCVREKGEREKVLD